MTIKNNLLLQIGSFLNKKYKKTDLLLAYLQEAEKQWFNELDNMLAPIKNPEERLWILFDFRLGRQLRTGFGGCQFVKISAEVSPDDNKVFKLVTHPKDMFRGYIKQLVTDLKRDEQQGLTNEILIETLYLLMEGATVTASIYKDASVLKNAKKIAKKLL